MGKLSRPRYGSLQFWPRKRVEKILPSVNWKPVGELNKEEGLLGFIAYKAGMTSVMVKDNTKDSLTKGKKMVLPATIVEVPSMKIYSVRFYKNGIVMKDVVVSIDKDLKRKIKAAKAVGSLENVAGYDDIKVLAYSVPTEIGLKKTPDMVEIGVQAKDKLAFIKSIINRNISLKEFAPKGLVDVRGVTRGKGLQGPVKRFGISFKSHKSEKGVRKPGSLAPWHPSRVTFRTPLAGQLGMFGRAHYNLKIILAGSASHDKSVNPVSGFKKYGFIKGDFIAIEGSVQGVPKRPILITKPFRQTKSKAKKDYEFVEFAK